MSDPCINRLDQAIFPQHAVASPTVTRVQDTYNASMTAVIKTKADAARTQILLLYSSLQY